MVYTKEKSEKTPTQPEQTVKVDISTPRRSDDLIFFSMKNPFKWLIKQFKTMLKKQNIVLQIPPFIAIPVLIALLGGGATGFFNLGAFVEKLKIVSLPTPTPKVIVRPTPIPKPLIISKLGYIKATYAVLNLNPTVIPTIQPTNTPIPTINLTDEASISAAPTNILSPTSTPIPTLTPTPLPSRYVLVDKNEKITFLDVPAKINLSYYFNQRVLVTGLYDSAQNILKITKSSDIEILP